MPAFRAHLGGSRRVTRPPKLPFPESGRVVKATSLLSEALKLVWLEHVALDRGEGAYIGAGHLGQRLGRSRDSVERDRRELIRVGLLHAGVRVNGRTGTYYPVMPADCIPHPRAPVGEVHRLAERLDGHIRQVRTGVKGVTGPQVKNDTVDAGPASEAHGVPGENRAQTGVTTVTGSPPLVEKYSTLPLPEGGEPQPSEGGGPVLTDGRGEKSNNGRSTAVTGDPLVRDLCARLEAKRQTARQLAAEASA